MHIDARTLDDHSIIEGDLCIVGAGAAGITLALQFLNTSTSVILLEGGGFEYEPAMQDLYRGTNVGLPYYPLESARLHYFGGTTGHWAGYCSEYDPIDFQQRAWVPGSGWPVTHNQLKPYYSKAANILELRQALPEEQVLKTSLPLNRSAIRDKMWYFSPPVRFGKKYRNTIVEARNISLYTYANVTEIITNEEGNAVKEVTIKNLVGKQHIVRAKTFVLACCSIQNARLLLASDRFARKGIGNEYDLVGRHFMEHLEMYAGDLYLPKPASLDLYRLQFFYTKARAELALTEEKQRELKVLNGTVALDPNTVPVSNSDPEQAATGNDTTDPASNLKGWESAEKYFESGEYKKETFSRGKRYLLFTRMEQSPNPDSRVLLDKEMDGLGMRRVTLNWQLTQLEKKSYRKLIETVGIACGEAGIGRVRLHEWLWDVGNTSWPSHLAGGWHHMGTTRMHASRREGVVDENCRVHGIQNLYIAGASCFPTAGSANPTFTIVAMTLRLADCLRTLQ